MQRVLKQSGSGRSFTKTLMMNKERNS